MSIESLILIVVIVILVFMCLLIFLTRYKKCPSDKIMVIYGKVGQNSDGTNRTSKCIHGGAAFIWPVIQSYQYLDLTPLSIQVDLKSALSRQNIRIDVPSIFTVGISTEQGIMQNAAERLLGLQMAEDVYKRQRFLRSFFSSVLHRFIGHRFIVAFIPSRRRFL